MPKNQSGDYPSLDDVLIKHQASITAYFGSLIISLWALLRFITVKSSFDLVGQQVLTKQWLNGQSSHAVIGTTNYLWKMLLLYSPMDELPGSPRLKLIILTLIVNIATFILLLVVLRALLKQLGVKITSSFYAALIFISALAGSIFWVQFTNSRNLEVVGGIFLIYLVLKYLSKPNRWLVLAILSFSAVLFFSDPLQLYMLALPLAIYSLITTYKNKQQFKLSLIVIGLLVAADVIAKLISAAAAQLFSISYSKVPGSSSLSSLSVSKLIHNVPRTLKAFVQLYEGGHEVGRIIELLNILLIVLAAAYFIYSVIKKRLEGRAVILVVLIVGIDSLVYLASGQAQIAGTSRYLIMTLPALVITLSSLKLRRPWDRIFIGALVLVAAVNVLAVGDQTGQAVDHRFSADQHLANIVTLVKSQHYPYAYASMDSAITATYYYDAKPTLLPLSCSNGRLAKSYLFYDREVFSKASAEKVDSAPIILDGTSINNYPSSCNEQTIAAQLGQPLAVKADKYGNQVLIYKTSQLAAL